MLAANEAMAGQTHVYVCGQCNQQKTVDTGASAEFECGIGNSSHHTTTRKQYTTIRLAF